MLDMFGRRILAQLPLMLLGISQPAIFVVAMFNTMEGYFVHANIDVRCCQNHDFGRIATKDQLATGIMSMGGHCKKRWGNSFAN